MPRILLIASDSDAIQQIMSHFSARGYDVLYAESGAQGVLMARRARPSAILLGLILPDMYGAAVHYELRTTPGTIYTPVILLAPEDSWAELRAGLKLRSDDYLATPADMEELERLVHDGLRGGRGRTARKRDDPARDLSASSALPLEPLAFEPAPAESPPEPLPFEPEPAGPPSDEVRLQKALAVLDSPESLARLIAVEALAQARYAPAAPRLVMLLSDKDDAVRAAALRALGSLDRPAVLNAVVERFAQLAVAERAVIVLKNPATGAFDQFGAGRGITEDEIGADEFKLALEIVAEAAQKGEPISTNNAPRDQAFNERQSIILRGLRAIAAVPIKAGDEVVGVVYLDKSVGAGMFGQNETDTLNYLAVQTAPAVEDAPRQTRARREPYSPPPGDLAEAEAENPHAWLENLPAARGGAAPSASDWLVDLEPPAGDGLDEDTVPLAELAGRTDATGAEETLEFEVGVGEQAESGASTGEGQKQAAADEAAPGEPEREGSGWLSDWMTEKRATGEYAKGEPAKPPSLPAEPEQSPDWLAPSGGAEAQTEDAEASPPPPPAPKPAAPQAAAPISPPQPIPSMAAPMLDDEDTAPFPPVREVSDVRAEAAPPAQDVQFAAYYPKETTPHVWKPLTAYVFKAAFADHIAADARKELGEALGEMRRVGETARREIKEGALITAAPDLPGFRFNPPSLTVGFYENWHRLDFKLQAHDAPLNQAANGRLTFSVEGIIVADIPLSIFVGETVTGGETASVTQKLYQAIFCSYSHDDTRIVERVERACRALGLDYLRDVYALKSGQHWDDQLLKLIDEADIFQLFWSQASAESNYVRQEWEYALKLNREVGNFIRPVYWEQPIPPVPPELGHIHFAYQPELRE